MAETAYATFSDRIHLRAKNRRTPIDGTLELTYRCNLNCRHCYCNLPATDADAKAREQTTEQVMRTLDQMAEAGTLYLLVTGGEAVLRRDFRDIWLYGKRKGFLMTLFSNGNLITDDLADFLAEWPPFRMEITLYGGSKETYENVTRVPGSFEQCWKGIRRLYDRGINLHLKTVLLEMNKADLALMRQQAAEVSGDFRLDYAIAPRLDRDRHPIACRVDPQEVISVDISDEGRAEEWKRLDALCCGIKERGLGTDEFSCGAGETSFSINPYGELQLCNWVPSTGYDLKQGLFSDGWNGQLRERRLGKVPESSTCASCRIAHFCDICPAWRDLEKVQAGEPIPYLCEMAYARAKAVLKTPELPPGLRKCEEAASI